MIRRPATLLALLTALNLLNYLDRFVLAAVLPKVEGELGLSHFLGGFLATVFLLGYFVTSPIFGTLADRGARRGLLAIGIAVWSIATVASGLAQGAASLIAARALVGVGEASYATIAPTLIDDVCPPEKRGKWLAIFYSAMPIGSAIGYVVGGAVGSHWGWRHAFYVAGGPGILLAGLCLLIKEPERRLSAEKPDVLASLKILWRVPLYRTGVLGYCAYTFAIGGFAYWAPSFLNERYGLDLGAANFRFGAITVVAGAIGTFVGGSLGDRAALRAIARAEKDGHRLTEAERDDAFVRANLRVCGISSLLGAPVAAACFLSPSPNGFFVFVFFTEVFLFLSTSPINAVILRSVPNSLRAGAMALSIFAIHLLGDLWSPPLVGAIADYAGINSLLAPVAVGAGGVLTVILQAARGDGIAKAMYALPVAIAISGVVWMTRGRKTAA